MPLSLLGTVIPMLEAALDGALLRFLIDEVDDPVCHRSSKRSTMTSRVTSSSISRFST
jgi:hypothetical protein